MQRIAKAFSDEETLRVFLEDVKDSVRNLKVAKLLMQVNWSSETSYKAIQDTIKIIEEYFGHDILIVGNTTTGCVLDGKVNRTQSTIRCTIYEEETTELQVLQFDFSGKNISSIAREVVNMIKFQKHVKSLEFISTKMIGNVEEFCKILGECDKSITIYGSTIPKNYEKNTNQYVFSNKFGITSDGMIFIITKGEDFHCKMDFCFEGWRILGNEKFQVTNCSESGFFTGMDIGNVTDVFKELGIITGNKSYVNKIVFSYNKGKSKYIRSIKHDDSRNHGGLQLDLPIENNTYVNISYFYPIRFLEGFLEKCKKMDGFSPNFISTIYDIDRIGFDETLEIKSLDEIAPTTGYCAESCFVRKSTSSHITTISKVPIYIGIREGKKQSRKKDNFLNLLKSYIKSRKNYNENAENEYYEMLCHCLSSYGNRVYKLYTTDDLTGISNRAIIKKSIKEALIDLNNDRCKYVSLMFLDVDKFKKINDIYGHTSGDIVLRKIGEILNGIEQKYENVKVARWGGDEFLILLKDYNYERAKSLAKEIQNEYSKKIFMFLPLLENSESKVIVTGLKFSIGVAFAEKNFEEQVLVALADHALYYVKKNGRGFIKFYDDECKKSFQARSNIIDNEDNKKINLVEMLKKAGGS